MEITWIKIEYGDGKFSVSNTGKVINNLSGKIYKTQIQNAGYELVHLNYKGKRKAFTVHRLVAISFIDLIKDKNFVDHIDGDRLHNCHLNLRWATQGENMRYASINGSFKKRSDIYSIKMKLMGYKYGFDNSQINFKKANPVKLFINNEVRVFRSLRQAGKELNIYHKTVADRIKKGMYSLPK